MKITLNSKDGNDTLIVIDSDSITIKKDGKTKNYINEHNEDDWDDDE